VTGRGQPATQWRGVSPTTEGRRECLSQNTVTGPMRQPASTIQVGSRPPANVSRILADSRQPSVVGVNLSELPSEAANVSRFLAESHQPFFVRGSTIRRLSAALAVQVCGTEIAARRGGRERLQPELARYVRGRVRLQCSEVLRHLQLCRRVLRFSDRSFEGFSNLATGQVASRVGAERSLETGTLQSSVLWSRAAWLCASASRPSVESRQRRTCASRSVMRATTAAGSDPSSWPRSFMVA
jgi:hypothetical protein